MSPIESPVTHAPPRPLERESVAWLVLLLTSLLTLTLWSYSKQYLASRAEERFHYRASQELNLLVSRMQAYEQVLLGGAALFAANGEVSREQWRAYIDRLQLETTLPGMQGTGFTQLIPARERRAHEQKMRAAGFADYRIQPPGERDPYTSIIYLEPFVDLNQRAFGYDMYSEPVRREAMERARDTGAFTLTGKVTLVQEGDTDVQPGFLAYVPVYAGSGPPPDAAERRRRLAGYVYSPFRAHDLMRAIFGQGSGDIGIELFDHGAAPENLLFSIGDTAHATGPPLDLPVSFGGRHWIARFHRGGAFEELSASREPQLILVGGLVLDLLLLTVMLRGIRYRRRLQAAAAQIAESRDRFQTLVENVPGTVFRTEPVPPWRALHVSRDIECLTGVGPERFLSGEVGCRAHLHPDDAANALSSITRAVAERCTYNIEYRVRGSDGLVRWASERGRASYDAGGQPLWIDGVIVDITDRKIAELAIRDLAFYDPLTSLPNRRLLLDRLHRQFAMSARSGLHGALLFVDLDKFKAINDGLGHHVGDLLLSEVARRLRAGVREGDTVARLGGDEFVVMLEDLACDAIAAENKAAAIASKLLISLNQPYQLETHALRCTPSIGLTTYCGHHTTADELLRRADSAMYAAKAAGSNRIRTFRDGAAADAQRGSAAAHPPPADPA